MSFCALVDGGKTKEAKLLLRDSVDAGQRLSIWKKILEVRSAGCPQLDTAALYWDTVDTCYGTRTLDTGGALARLPGCVDTAHVPAYSLSSEGAARVARLVTVLAYNCPDIPHLPLVFPSAALLLVAGAGEEEAYEVISMMVAPPPAQNINYFTQTRGGWDVLCFSLKPLAQKYIVRSPHLFYSFLPLTIVHFRKAVSRSWSLSMERSSARSCCRTGPGGSSRTWTRPPCSA